MPDQFLALTHYWPYALLIAVAAALTSKKGGRRVIRTFQFLDHHVVRFFRLLSWIPAAFWKSPQHEEPKWRSALRWTWFIAFFVLVFVFGYLTQYLAPSWPSAHRLVAIFVGYLIALAVARTWVGEQSQNLDQNSINSGKLATKLRPRAMLSIFFLLILIPLSFDAAHDGLGWYEDNDRNIADWGLVTIHLLFRAAVDFLELLNTNWKASNLEYNRIGEGALVLTHFVTLGYVVVTGIGLVARGDHAMHSDVTRLVETGKVGNVPRHGERVVNELTPILQNPNEYPTAAVAAAIEALGVIRREHDIAPPKVFELLRTAISDDTSDIRASAALAIGRWESEESARILYQIIRDGSELLKVRNSAVYGINAVRHIDRDYLEGLIECAINAHTAGVPGRNKSLRLAIIDVFRSHPHYLDTLGIRETIEANWLAVESEPDVQDSIRETFGAPILQRLSHARHKFRSGKPAERLEGAKELAKHIDVGVVVKELMTCVRSSDEDLQLRERALRSLYETQIPEVPKFPDEITQCLRGRLGTKDEFASLRILAAEGLRFFRPASIQSQRLLRRITRSDDDSFLVQTATAQTLFELGILEPDDRKNVLTQIQKRVASRKQVVGESDHELDPKLVNAIESRLHEMINGKVEEEEEQILPSRVSLTDFFQKPQEQSAT